MPNEKMYRTDRGNRKYKRMKETEGTRNKNYREKCMKLKGEASKDEEVKMKE